MAGVSVTVDSSDPANPVVALAGTVTNRPTFNSGAATSPFQVGGASIGVLVTGLNADKLDGNDASDFAAAVHTHAASAIVSGRLALARGGTDLDASATGGAKHVVMQESAGAAFTVRILATTDIPDLSATYLTPAAAAAAYQPLDADLTAIAALATASYGRSLLTLSSATALAAEIPAGAITVTQMANLADQRILGNVTGGAAAPAALTQAQARTFLGLVSIATTGSPADLVAGILTENVYVGLTTGLSADGKFSGLTVDGTAGAALAFGDVCYLAVADSRWKLADASAASTSGDVQLAICVLAAAGDGSATRMLLFGTIRADAKFPTLTVGAAVHVSETAGAVVVAAPTTTDSVTRRLGFAITADSFHFNPSNDYYSHV